MKIIYFTKAFFVALLAMFFISQFNQCTNDNLKVPEVITTDISDITESSCKCGGEVILDGGSPVTARGICWSTAELPTISDNKTNNGQGSGVFSTEITGLELNTIYYLRAYATNDIGTGYGEIKSVTPGTIMDIDGNIYHTVTIGSQIWIAENLKVKRYRNGDEIPTTSAKLNVSQQPKYQWAYDENTGFISTYGLLYTWFVVTDSRGLCPAGWRVPADSDWHTLALYLDADAVNWLDESSIAGGKLKELGTRNWNSPNTGANNETGFTALPGGERVGINATFYSIGDDANYWTSTEESYNTSWNRKMFYNNAFLQRYPSEKTDGYSVRCLKE